MRLLLFPAEKKSLLLVDTILCQQVYGPLDILEMMIYHLTDAVSIPRVRVSGRVIANHPLACSHPTHASTHKNFNMQKTITLLKNSPMGLGQYASNVCELGYFSMA